MKYPARPTKAGAVDLAHRAGVAIHGCIGGRLGGGVGCVLSVGHGLLLPR